MLDAFVIEEIQRRERDRGRDDRPAIRIPVPTPPEPSPEDRPDTPGTPDHGVIIIDYGAPARDDAP
jgi:hypothetical protein